MLQRDKNRAELVRAIIRQNGGRIFTVIAKRKTPKHYFIIEKLCPQASEFLKGAYAEGDKVYITTKKAQHDFNQLSDCPACSVTEHQEHFMTMTCRTGVKKDLKGGKSTIAHDENLVSVNLTNGKGYRCFSAFNVLELRAGGTVIKFKEADVLAFEG